MNEELGRYKKVPFGTLCEISGRNSDYFRVSDYVTESEGIVAVSPGNIQGGKIVFDDVIYLSREAYGKSDTGTVHNGDILLNKYCKPKTAPYRSALAKNLPEDQITIANPSLFLISHIKCDPRYLQLVIISSDFQRALNTVSTGSMNALSGSSISKIMVPLPDNEEQNRIVELYELYRDKNEELIGLLEREIKDRQAVFSQSLNDALWK